MESFLIYILKASALLGVFYLSYLFLLKNETSFNLNRKFLIAGLFTSLILPLIHLTRKVYIEAAPSTFDYIPATVNYTDAPVENSLDWWQISGIIYLIVTGFFLFRLCIQVIAVIKIILTNKVQNIAGLKYLEISADQLPFSFFNYIVFNPYKHSEKDLKLILEHEKVHARQLHSVDIILVNLISCIFWFNPFSWFYKRSVEQNLEFIADRETVLNTSEIKEYQHALVKVSIADLKPALTNHFYQSFIKKRILMLNKKSSNQSPAWKLSLVMPLILAFMLLFNVKTEAQIVEKKSQIAEKSESPEPQQEPKLEIEIEEEIEIAEAPEEIEVEIEEAPEVSWTTETRTTRRRSMGDLGIDPLYVLNGKKYKASKLKNKYISLGSEFEILTGEDATNTFGEDAKAGAIIIPDAEIIKNFDKVMEEIGGNNQFSGRYIMVDETGKPNYVRLNSSTSAPKHEKVIFGKGRSIVRAFPKMSDYQIMHGSVPNGINGTGVYEFRTKDSGHNVRIRKISNDSNKVYFQTQNSEPIYVVNEEIQTKDFLQLIDPEDIASINVLKGGMAIKEYGSKAKNGVIVIKTKEFTGESDASIFQIKNTYTNAEIEALKNQVSEKTDYELELKGIKRNDQGIITNIEVKFYNSQSMVNSNYSNSNGVPDIHVGLRKGGGLIISTSE